VRHGGFGGPGWEPVPPPAPVLSPAAMRILCASPFMCMVAGGAQGRAVAAQSRGAIALWCAIVRHAQDILRVRYGVPLLVVLWDRDTPLDDKIIAAVLAESEERGGMQVASVRLMPELFDGRFWIPVDEHPTPQAYDALAAALLDAIEDGRVRLGPLPALD